MKKDIFQRWAYLAMMILIITKVFDFSDYKLWACLALYALSTEDLLGRDEK